MRLLDVYLSRLKTFESGAEALLAMCFREKPWSFTKASPFDADPVELGGDHGLVALLA